MSLFILLLYCFPFLQVGTVLDALETSNQASSTVVALFSDHGWKLGEFGLWGKHTALHADIHVPLMVYNV